MAEKMEKGASHYFPAYREENRELLRKKNRKYYENNRESIRKKRKIYRQNPEVREKRKAYDAKWRKANPEKRKEIGRHFRENHREEINVRRRAVRMMDLTGQKFGKLNVIIKKGRKRGSDYPMFECRCECENVVIVQGNHLLNGNVKDCGCEKK